MFERAKLFKEKYQDVQIANDSASLLAKEHRSLSDAVNELKYNISIMESEYEILENDLNDFLMQYYEMFSEALFINDDLLEKYNSKRGACPEDKMNENIALYERKKKARDSEIKTIYRKLVKEAHPDLNGSSNEFVMINEMYKNNDLEGLINVQTELENQKVGYSDIDSPGLVREIEVMESHQILLQRKFNKTKIKLNMLISSPEYKLYTRYKIAHMRGEDFFETLLKAI
jgi:hypothetical protein